MIQLKNISKQFDQKVLFNNLNININKGETLLLKAPSGSGKTTLIRLIMGFEKPDSGEIIIKGKPLNKHTLKSAREAIAYVSQDADLDLTTVRNMLDHVFSYKVNKHIKDYEANFYDYCHLFHLEKSIYDKEIKSISGGERQRIALIIAFLLDRPIMILDEITSGLDSDLKNTIRDYIVALDKTVIIISHDEIWHNHDTVREVSLNGIH